MNVVSCTLRQYMLASAKVDTSQLSRTLNALQPASAFTPLELHTDTDIALISRQAHQSVLVSCIEEGRRQTIQDFHASLRQNMLDEWERQKAQVFEQLNKHHPTLLSDAAADVLVAGGGSGPAADGSSPKRRSRRLSTEGYGSSSSTSASFSNQQLGPGSELAMHTKMMRYDAAVSKINQARLYDVPIAAASTLAEAALSAGLPGVDSRALPLGETYALLSALVGEKDLAPDAAGFSANPPREGQYAAAHAKTGFEAESQSAVQLRRGLVEGGRSFLQNQ